MEYEKESQAEETQTQKEIISDDELELNAPESIGIKEIKRPHHYFITCEQAVAMFGMPERASFWPRRYSPWRRRRNPTPGSRLRNFKK